MHTSTKLWIFCFLAGCGVAPTGPDWLPTETHTPPEMTLGNPVQGSAGMGSAGMPAMVAGAGGMGGSAGSAGIGPVVQMGLAGRGSVVGTGGSPAMAGSGGSSGAGGVGGMAGADGLSGAGGSGGMAGASGAGGMAGVGGTAGTGPCTDSDSDTVCDAADACPGFDDRLDADSDGTPDGCDRCAGKSDADADANGYPDACDKILFSLDDPPRAISTILPFKNPRAILSFDSSATATFGALVIATLPLQSETINITDARTLSRIEIALRDWMTQYAKTRFTYDTTSSTQTVNLTTTMAFTHLTADQHVTRIVCTGYASSSGVITAYWQIRGY